LVISLLIFGEAGSFSIAGRIIKETLMISESNIYTNGKYFENNPTWDVEDSQWKADIITSIFERNKLAIHQLVEVGCGAGGILSCLAEKNPNIKTLKGYDISPQAISLAENRKSQRVQFYLGDFINDDSETNIDILLVIDVLEHISDYYGFLQKLKDKSRHFVFHIPLDLSCRTILKPHVMFQQRKAVGHLHYFSEEIVWWFLKDSGFTVIDWEYTKPVTDIKKSRSFKQYIKKKLRNFSYSINKKNSVKLWGGYSLMILAQQELTATVHPGGQQKEI
jgi:SAM-dependent methyltransferase